MQALLEKIAGSNLSNEIDDAGRARAQLGFCFQQPLRVTGDSINELLVGRRDDFLQLGLPWRLGLGSEPLASAGLPELAPS